MVTIIVKGPMRLDIYQDGLNNVWLNISDGTNDGDAEIYLEPDELRKLIETLEQAEQKKLTLSFDLE